MIEKLQVSEGLVNLDIDVPWFYGHNCSYTKLKEEVKQKSFSTEWGPVRFTKENHPLSIMVRNSTIASHLSHSEGKHLLLNFNDETKWGGGGGGRHRNLKME